MERLKSPLAFSGWKVVFATLVGLAVWEFNAVSAGGSSHSHRRAKDSNSLNYHRSSLTDHSRNNYLDERNNERNITWVIGKPSCQQLQPGCMCDLEASREEIRGFKISKSVICSCSDSEQVVNVKGTGQKDNLNTNETWKWTVQGCSKVILHQNILSAFFGAGNGLFVEFNNISSLIIQESAFTLKDSGNTLQRKTKVQFKNCSIENVPPKAFPSNLSTVKFMNSKIGTLSSQFIQSLQMGTIIFENSSVKEVKSEAFYKNAIIESLIAINSEFKVIHPNAVASALQDLNWSGCRINRIQKHGLSGPIATVVITKCTVDYIETQGFFVNSWTKISLINNTFNEVNRKGIDLSHPAGLAENVQPARLTGNSWGQVETDFITTGTTSESDEPFAIVTNNTFLSDCSCESKFTSFLTLNGSKAWFHEELFKSSKCRVDEKLRICLETENGTEDGFVIYEDLSLLCSTETFMCLSEVKDVPLSPQIPDRLKVLACLIGAFVLFMIISLFLTMCVYMLRKKKPGKVEMNGNSNDLCSDLPRKEFVKSLNNEQYGAISHKIPKTPSLPTRVALLEDVEMEDKGVQTMPTELSADIIEGLREKLSKPDSFWDAKETIDHLYDLIHVREQSTSISSPPDVTVCNDNSEIPASSNSSAHNISHDSLKLLISPSRRVPKISPTDRSPRKQMSTFAQVPSPSKSAQICDYRDPSDSQLHIYSELTAHPGHHGKLTNVFLSPSQGKHDKPNPIVCEYTEPSDFQTHIYAELSAVPQNTANKNGTSSSPTKTNHTQTNFNSGLTDSPVRDVPVAPMQIHISSSVILPSSSQNQHYSSKLNDLNSDPMLRSFPVSDSNSTQATMLSSDGSFSSNIPTVTVLTNTPQTNRPLPSIPVPSFSNVQ